MIYVIGGPARCGKSTLAAQVRHKIDGLVLSGDAFVHALQENLRSEWIPDIFDHAVANVSQMHDIETRIDRLRRRDEIMWQFYQSYLVAALADAPHDDILLEGNIWPDFLELFSLEHEAVFLIDTSIAQSERLISIRDSGTDSDNNWMQDFTDEKMVAWAAFNAARSQRYVKLCSQHHYRYFDIAELGIQQAESQAFEHLLKKTL